MDIKLSRLLTRPDKECRQFMSYLTRKYARDKTGEILNEKLVSSFVDAWSDAVNDQHRMGFPILPILRAKELLNEVKLLRQKGGHPQNISTRHSELFTELITQVFLAVVEEHGYQLADEPPEEDLSKGASYNKTNRLMTRSK